MWKIFVMSAVGKGLVALLSQNFLRRQLVVGNFKNCQQDSGRDMHLN